MIIILNCLWMLQSLVWQNRCIRWHRGGSTEAPGCKALLFRKGGCASGDFEKLVEEFKTCLTVSPFLLFSCCFSLFGRRCVIQTPLASLYSGKKMLYQARHAIMKGTLTVTETLAVCVRMIFSVTFIPSSEKCQSGRLETAQKLYWQISWWHLWNHVLSHQRTDMAWHDIQVHPGISRYI